MDGYQHTAAILKALGHPARLRILQVLQQDEACACHLETTLGLRQATISQHLAQLHEEGLVVDHRDGMNVYYALTDPSLGDFLDAALALTARLTRILLDTELPNPAAYSTEACPCPRCREQHPLLETSLS